MSTKKSFTVAILAKNEEKNIRDCIVPFTDLTDDMIVLDHASSDATAEHAKLLGANVVDVSGISSFGARRNIALKQARYDWVLFVDADERPDEKLLSWLKDIEFTNDTVCYHIPRIDYFWGKAVRHGEVATASSGMPRLMNRKYASYEGHVHETVKIKGGGGTETATGTLMHYPHQTLSEFVRDVNVYSSARADELRGKKSELLIVFEMIVYPPAKFWYTYIVKLGFLDGAPGFVYSFLMAFHSFLVRAKLLAKSP